MEQRYDDPSEELDLSQSAPEEEYDDQEPQEPQLVRVRLNGKTVMVTEDVADAIQAREADYQRQISKMGTELGQLRRQPQEPARASEPPTADEDLGWYQSPSKAAAAREAKLREDLRNELRKEQELERAQARWWGKFYADNPDLKDDEEAVQFIVQRNYDTIKDLDQAECHRELADRTRKFLKRPAQGHGTRRQMPSGQVETERSSNPPPASRPRQQDEPTQRPRLVGLSAEVARRAEERRRAAFNIKKDK